MRRAALAFASLVLAASVTGPGPAWAQRTCDDPENPCYTPEQMASYFRHHTHHFIHLNPDYRFPKAFVQAAVKTHQRWCGHHPDQCDAQRKAWPDDCSTWWCSERYGVTCAGGAGDIYWSCPGGWTNPSAEHISGKLSHTQRVIIGCGGVTLIAVMAPEFGAYAVVSAASACFWQTFYSG